MKRNDNDKALGDIRVLDFAGPMGIYCTKLLADLGADVIRIEPPGGDETRNIGPFFKDDIHPEKSLYYFHYNTNKRSITLNLDTVDGRDILKNLVKTTDIMVETFEPGYLDSIGMGYPVLKKINPALILTSITGFGQTGPYRDFKAYDIIGLAMSGILDSVGFPEDPPTMLACSQAYHMASTNAAIGTMMALYNRDKTGEGQWIDVPMQGVLLRMAEFSVHAYWASNTIRKRSGVEFYRGVRDLHPCKDGSVLCSALGGSGAKAMLEWMESEGMVADLGEEKYQTTIKFIEQGIPMGKGSQQKVRMDTSAQRLQESDIQKTLLHIEEVWDAFLMTHTREELLIGAQSRGVRLMPVKEANDIVEDIGLNARDYFINVDHPELGTSIKYPGPPYRFSKTPWTLSNRAPLIGEHNAEIYEKELGLSQEKVATMKASNVI